MSELKHPATLWYTSVLTPVWPRFPDCLSALVREIDRLRPSTKGLTKTALQYEEAAAIWVLEGLYQAYFSIPRAAMALPLSERFYTDSKANRVPHPFGSIQRIVKALQSLEWVKIYLGVYRHPSGEVTTLEASGALAKLFAVEYLEWEQFEPPDDETLILVADDSKDKTRRTVSRSDSPEVGQWQDNLRLINESLLSHCIYLDAPNEVILQAGALVDGSDARSHKIERGPLSFSQVTLRRIFARGRLDRGGRFYGGWWQNIPSQYRKRIGIDDSLTCEADYSGMALNCLYALENRDIGLEDAYDIGLAYTSLDDPRRKLVKKYVNAILNDEKGTYQLPHDDQRALGLTRAELRARVAQRHIHIAHHFHTGIGLELQFYDSQVAERVMLRFTKQGDVCLPIHDSFIVKHSLGDELVQAMNEEYRSQFGKAIRINPETVVLNESTACPDPNHIPVGLTESQQVEALHQIHWGRVSIANRYYTSWVMKTKSLEEINAEYMRAVETWKEIRPLVAEKTRGVKFP